MGQISKSVSKYLLLGFFVLSALSLSMGYSLQEEVRKLLAEHNLSNNLVFFLLINLNIAVLTVLAFLVIQNVVRLVLDRRRNILGARLRSRLVVAFVGLSLVPTVVLFIVSRGILSSVMSGWFSPQISASVEGALGVAKLQFETAQRQIQRNVGYTSRELAELSPYISADGTDLADPRSIEVVQDYLNRKRDEYGLVEFALVNPDGVVLARSTGAEAANNSVELPAMNMRAVRDAVYGTIITRPEQSRNSEFLRVYSGLPTSPTSGLAEQSANRSTSDNQVEVRYPSHYVLVGTLWFPPGLNAALSDVLDSYDDYMELKTYRRPLASSYILSLAVITIMIVFAAIWVGFYLARGLSGPIQQLAQGTDQIAHGNLDYRIPEVSDDELGVLVSSFNRMTEDLQLTTNELVARRRYMEAILANVGVGVISLDENGCITTFNRAASVILGIAGGQGVHFRQALPAELADRIESLQEDLKQTSDRAAGGNVALVLGDNAKNIQLGITRLVDEQGRSLGLVVLLDDLTELVNAQRMAAWQDVAKRIAHEIKNPLTPIQLSAERIQRRVDSGLNTSTDVVRPIDSAVITDCTSTIVKQVEVLRGLVNEFSRFARMPKSNPQPVKLNQLISETEAIFQEAHPRIKFVLELDPALPEIELDRDQIGRVLVNLLDNAVASIDAYIEQYPREDSGDRSGSGFFGEITIKSYFDGVLGLAAFHVADTGLGIPDSDKPKLFEPYFSKRKGGTGLGLAIVGSIVADHNGFIRIRDNKPRGAIFVIELPVRDHLQVLRQAG